MIGKKKGIKIMFLTILTSFLMLFTYVQIVSAAVTQYEANYDGYDGSGAVEYIFYDDTYYFNYSVKVEYDMGKGPCIITGLRFFYGSWSGSPGSHDTRIRFEGDTQSVSWLVDDLPYKQPKNWHTLIYSGPTYLIDDDPDIVMIGLEPQSNCFYVWMDPLGYNHSYERSIFTGQWDLVTNYEYMIEARYEEVDNLTLSSSKTGSITSTDFVDAYFVELSENFQYNFTLNVTSGTGNLNMRLVSNQELTNNLLNSTTGSSNPEYMTYTASSTETHVLLVEPETSSTDIADYTISFTENRMPNANFTANASTLLVNDPVQFTFTGDPGDTPTTYTWNFGDGSPTSDLQNPVHQYSSAGSYTVSLNVTDSDGDERIETKTDYISVEVDTTPTANFTANATNIIAGDIVQFTYTGTSGNQPLTFEWNFGDGSPTSDQQNPIHQYTTSNNYTVSLNVTDNDDDSDVETKVDFIKVDPNVTPLANFTANVTNIFINDYIQFTFTGNPGNTPSTYTWNFGDGSPTSELQNPVHQYTSVGNYTVSVNVTDTNGEESIETKTDYINVEVDTSPTANFTANVTNINIGDFVQFSYTGTDGNQPLTFEWNFGDGSPTSDQQNPIHQYTTSNNYTVSLNVTDNDDDSDVETKVDFIKVDPNMTPLANFTANVTNIFTNEYIQFTFTGNPGNTPSTYTWNFGDGSPTSELQNPVHQYTSVGNYTVSVNVTDSDNEESIETKIDYIIVEVDTTPIANFTANITSIIAGDIVQFTYTGMSGNQPLTFEWDFGDGSPTSDQQNPFHQYLDAGRYNVSLIVMDREGDNDTINKEEFVIVNSKNQENEIIPGFDIEIILVIGLIGTISLSYKFHKKK